jgi:hypothetical protein
VTAPPPPPEEQPPPPPPRQYAVEAEAVRAAQDAEVSAVLPALAAFVTAVMAYARTGGRVAGSPLTVARKIGYYGAVGLALAQIAERALDHQRTYAGSRAAEELWLSHEVGQAAGVDAGLTVLAQAARHIAREARTDEATGGSPGVSLPGEPYDPKATEHAKTYADPEQIALPVVQNTRHAAQMAAAEEAGWVRKTWVDMHDTRVRASHAFLGSTKYEYHTVPIAEPFVTINDNKLWYPGDTSAPVEEWIRCRCWLKLSR